MIQNSDNNIQAKSAPQAEETDRRQSSVQELVEKPVITIEDDDAEEKPAVAPQKHRKFRAFAKYAAIVVSIALLVLACYKAKSLYNYYHNIGVSVSVTPKGNIGKLAVTRPQGDGESAIQLTSDSILGVALNVYALQNVRAEMTLVEPDTADHSVLMYVRTADYTASGKYLGSLVINGEELRSDVSRLGYCAISGGNMVIGVSRYDDVKDYVINQGGSYFRQFILVSDGMLPSRFRLHGKVERKALARTATDRICIVETRHPETLWDFADALREYGFVDAIYLTGGNEVGFYRNPDGSAVCGTRAAEYRDYSLYNVTPWLVLRQKK